MRLLKKDAAGGIVVHTAHLKHDAAVAHLDAAPTLAHGLCTLAHIIPLHAGESVYTSNGRLLHAWALFKHDPWMCGNGFSNHADLLGDHSDEIGCLDNCSS